MPSVSIIINNFNYARYLVQCVESALAQTEAPCEVIVVDDGSTDDSVSRLEHFGDRIVLLCQRNQGQAAAMNAGFAHSTGEVVIFLDADDCLEPNVVETISPSWNGDWAKAHFPLWLIDADGTRIGRLPERGESLPCGNLLPELLRNGTYFWMPTSGNVYARSTLERIFPIPADDFRISADLYLSVRSVRHGIVGAFSEVLGSYRIHGGNRFNSDRLLAPDEQALRSRVASHVARCNLLKQETADDEVSPFLRYTTFYGWFDLTLAWKLFGAEAVNPYTAEMLCEGIKWRGAQRFHGGRWVTLGLICVFAVLRNLPVPVIRGLLAVGRWIDPWIIKPLARILARRAV